MDWFWFPLKPKPGLSGPLAKAPTVDSPPQGDRNGMCYTRSSTMQSIKRLLNLKYRSTLSASFLLLSFASALGGEPAQNGISRSGHVQIVWAGGAQLHQVSPGKGWLLMYANSGSSWENHVYWTNNNGDQWSDITPPIHSNEYLDSASFLDESHGWVCIASGAGDWDDARLAIRKGDHWLSVALDNSYAVEGFRAPFDVQFVDPLHGWMVIYSPGSQAVDPGPNQLAATSDGGLTWKKLPPTPVSGGILFLSPKRGLLISRSPENGKQELWITGNGGKSWMRKSLPMPGGFEDWRLPIGLGQSMPHLENKQDSAWLVEYEPPEHEDWKNLAVKYVTSDGGETWQIRKTELYDENHKDLFGPRTIVGSHVFQVRTESSGQPASIFPSINRARWQILVYRDGVQYALSGLPQSLAGAIQQVSFGDELHGWVLMDIQRCTDWCGGSPEAALAALSGKDRSCAFGCLQFTKSVEILSTSDGGYNFKVVTPVFPSKSRP